MDQANPASTSGRSPASESRPLKTPDLEVKDTQLIFNKVWKRLEDTHGRENLIFPKEIMWLGGAPGSGKGTNTPFIMRERGIDAPPIVMSSLLDSPEMRALKDQGRMVGDYEAVDALLHELLDDQYKVGVVVDGFPRTPVQVACVKMLHDKMLELRREFFNKPIGPRFRRPIFRVVVLFVDEEVSIQRQLKRGREVREHNKKAREEGGELLEERVTDFDEELARGRYQTFKEKTYDALLSLRKFFHYHWINAQVPLEEVERNIKQEFQYQSTLELGHDTYDSVHRVPLAADIIRHARQELVRRLDNYQHRYTELFSKVIDVIEAEFVDCLRRHAFSGRAVVKSQNPVFEERMAVDMAMDVLSERGYHVLYDTDRWPIPEQVDLETGRIACLERRIHRFEIRFVPPEIRRGG